MSWTGGATNRRLLALAVVVAAMPVAGLAPTHPAPFAVFVALLVAALTLTAALALACVRVALGPGGVQVGAGPWGWPVRAVPAAEIVGARAEVREPDALGTLGYHDTHGHTTVMVRRGECLVLDLAGGRTLTVAVDGAAVAASCVNAVASARPR